MLIIVLLYTSNALIQSLRSLDNNLQLVFFDKRSHLKIYSAFPFSDLAIILEFWSIVLSVTGKSAVVL